MKKKNQEYNDFARFKMKAKSNDNYYITVFYGDTTSTINLSEYKRNLFTFGSDAENDIVIKSDNIDKEQGYFELTDFGIQAVNTSKKFQMVGNDNKPFEDLYLSGGSFIKIINPDDTDLSNSILFIMSIGENLDEWKSYPIAPGLNTIGSSNSCDLVLPSDGVAKKHASISSTRKHFTIKDENSLNGTFVNGRQLISLQNAELNDFDIILIGNSKIIFHNNHLYYQIYQRGIQLDAVDIVKRVKIKFKTKEISSHVTMEVKPSEFVAFVGGSGAGKTTFMKCISGVNSPSSGKVLLNGENLHEDYEYLKYNIGYVPQEDIVYSNLTLHDMLKFTAKLRMPDNSTKAERTKKIQEVLDIVQLSEFENSYIRQLSGGQRKRASIATELIADPSLIFLDEPTSGLDPDTERSVMQTLQKMSRMGKTIILVTHNTLNLHLCDKVAFFGAGGKLCFYGKPKEALDFFGVTDFVDIYTLLSEDVNKWHEKFHDLYGEKEQEIIDKYSIPKPIGNRVPHKRKSFIKQLITLIIRYIKLISNDFMQLLLLFAQAPIVGLLLTTVTNDQLYKSYDDTKAVLFSLGCASIWLGLLNSVQEICKEKVILQKEHMSDLKLSTYLLSKFIVQGLLAFIQATLMVGVFQKIVGASENNILLGSFWDIQIICFLSILSAAALGLFISSLVRNSNLAMSIIPLILVPQLLFSGMLFKLDGVADFISNFVLCRWSVEGLGTSANLNDLTHMVQTINPLLKVDPEDYFAFTSEHFVHVILIISLMTLVLMVLSYIVLRKNVDKNM